MHSDALLLRAHPTSIPLLAAGYRENVTAISRMSPWGEQAADAAVPRSCREPAPLREIGTGFTGGPRASKVPYCWPRLRSLSPADRFAIASSNAQKKARDCRG